MQKKKYLSAGFIFFYIVFGVSVVTFIIDFVYMNRLAVPVFSSLQKAEICTQSWIVNIQNYLDITIAIITAIIVALLTITITIFVFLKSALDRIIDENRYIKDVANIYKTQSTQVMFKLCWIGILGLILSLLWHLLLSLNDVHSKFCLLSGLIGLAVMLICNLVLSFLFWRRCIRVERALRNIIITECDRLQGELKKHPAITDNNSLVLIGDWSQWETDGVSKAKLRDYGERLCANTAPEQFINLFARLEILLLTGEQIDYGKDYHDSDIITVLREREDILNPNLKVERQDLADRYYLNDHDAKDIIDYVGEFEKNVGYGQNMNGNNKFFENIETLYSVLNQYRDLLISWDFTTTKSTEQTINNGKSKRDRVPGDIETLKLFAQGLYYFFLQILSLFVSAIHISNYSFNGITLNFANFYSSTLEHVTFYSSEFYHTILSRAQLIQVVMDISRFDSIDFYNTKIADSTINNATFSYVNFEDSQMEGVGLSTCEFNECRFNNSEFIGCVLNSSEFYSCKLNRTNFSHSKMHNVIWDKTEIDFCDFHNADIKNWQWRRSYPILKQCNFAGSLWSQMTIRKGNLSDCDFSEADLSKTGFDHTNLEAAIFQQCNLAETQIHHCKMAKSTLEKALLFAADISDSDLSMASLFEVSAVKLIMKNCILTDSNCADADFSGGDFFKTNFYAARLYDCSLSRAKLQSCKCNYLLADHLQFTFTECKDCSFQYSALSESNLTKSKFDSCSFNKSDLTGLNAAQTEFCNCYLVNVDFSGTRFIETIFQTTLAKAAIIKNCNFSDCNFENVIFDHIFFEDCVFKNAIFVNCYFKRGDTSCLLTRTNFDEISNQSQDGQISLVL